MKRIRLWLVLIVIWFFFLYNIEKVSEPINLATFVYVYVALISIAMLVLPPLYTVDLYWPFLLALVPYFFMKNYFKYHIWGTHLPITVTEICAIGITILLIGQFLRELRNLQEAVLTITMGQIKKGDNSFNVGQSQIYREIRRARQYHRPATLLAIAITNESYNLSLSHFIQEAQWSFIHHYISARTADLLVEELKDSGIVTQRDDHFVVLLPETDFKSTDDLITRLKNAAKERLGLDLRVGKAGFPDEAVTLESLLECAEKEMEEPPLSDGSQTGSASNSQGLIEV